MGEARRRQQEGTAPKEEPPLPYETAFRQAIDARAHDDQVRDIAKRVDFARRIAEKELQRSKAVTEPDEVRETERRVLAELRAAEEARKTAAEAMRAIAAAPEPGQEAVRTLPPTPSPIQVAFPSNPKEATP